MDFIPAPVPTPQQLFLTQALPVLARTPGLVGVAIGGSWLDNAVDAWSELDLVLVMSLDAAGHVLA